MKRSFLVVAVLFVTFGLVTPSAAQGVAKPDSLASAANNSPAAANLAKQAERNETAKIDTLSTIGAIFFISARTAKLPDYKNGVFALDPKDNDSLWFSIAFHDSLAAKELHDIAFYAARFEGSEPKWEIYFFSIDAELPENLEEKQKRENYDLEARNEILRWSYSARKSFLGKIDLTLDTPSFGRIEPHRVKIRSGFELAGKRLGILVKRPTYNLQSLRKNDESLSAFAGIQLTARKASSGNALTGSLATNGAAPAQDWGSLVSWLVAGFVILSVITIWGIAYKRKAKKA